MPTKYIKTVSIEKKGEKDYELITVEQGKSLLSVYSGTLRECRKVAHGFWAVGYHKTGRYLLKMSERNINPFPSSIKEIRDNIRKEIKETKKPLEELHTQFIEEANQSSFDHPLNSCTKCGLFNMYCKCKKNLSFEERFPLLKGKVFRERSGEDGYFEKILKEDVDTCCIDKSIVSREYVTNEESADAINRALDQYQNTIVEKDCPVCEKKIKDCDCIVNDKSVNK